MCPDVAGPVTAKCHVKDDVVVSKLLVNVTTTFEFGHGLAPSTWIGVATREVIWNGGSWEEIDAYGIAGPVGRIDSTAVCVEARPVR